MHREQGGHITYVKQISDLCSETAEEQQRSIKIGMSGRRYYTQVPRD